MEIWWTGLITIDGVARVCVDAASKFVHETAAASNELA